MEVLEERLWGCEVWRLGAGEVGKGGEVMGLGVWFFFWVLRRALWR